MSENLNVHSEPCFERRHLTCGVGLVLLALGAALVHGMSSAGAAVVVEARIGVDPDRAPWWELAALPRIGETTARAIVEYREAARVDGRRVFREPADLARVKGIGPKTVQRTARHLRFENG